LLRQLSPLYLRLGLRVRSVRLLGADQAVDAYDDFQRGKKRLLIAFRHAYGDEPQLIAHTLLRTLPREARRLGRPLAEPTHAHFIHGYEVPRWGGPVIRWLLPRMGSVPIHHAKLDSPSLKRIRKLMSDGAYPLALAPEGQTSYASTSVPRLEAGTAHMGLWALADLRAQGRTEGVAILPLSLHYEYGPAAAGPLAELLTRLETHCGLAVSAPPVSRTERLGRIARSLLESAENYYDREHRAQYRAATGVAAAALAPPGSLNARWRRVLDAALRTGEDILGLPADADPVHRVYRIRQAAWDRIFREQAPDSPLRAALNDRSAGEAWYAMRHMELVDLGYYLDLDGISADDTLSVHIERALNLWDLASRLRGGTFADRPVLAPRDATVVAGQVIDLAPIASRFESDRRRTADAVMAELNAGYLSCIKIYTRERVDGKR